MDEWLDVISHLPFVHRETCWSKFLFTWPQTLVKLLKLGLIICNTNPPSRRATIQSALTFLGHFPIIHHSNSNMNHAGLSRFIDVYRACLIRQCLRNSGANALLPLFRSQGWLSAWSAVRRSPGRTWQSVLCGPLLKSYPKGVQYVIES